MRHSSSTPPTRRTSPCSGRTHPGRPAHRRPRRSPGQVVRPRGPLLPLGHEVGQLDRGRGDRRLARRSRPSWPLTTASAPTTSPTARPRSTSTTGRWPTSWAGTDWLRADTTWWSRGSSQRTRSLRSSRAMPRARRSCRSSWSASPATRVTTRAPWSRPPSEMTPVRLLGAVWDQQLLDALYAGARSYVTVTRSGAPTRPCCARWPSRPPRSPTTAPTTARRPVAPRSGSTAPTTSPTSSRWPRPSRPWPAGSVPRPDVGRTSTTAGRTSPTTTRTWPDRWPSGGPARQQQRRLSAASSAGPVRRPERPGCRLT
jgi:hypothetical protein